MANPLAHRGTLLLGLWERRGLSLAMLLVAIIAAGAATTGPLYFNAARTSIVQDELHDSGSLARGVDVASQTGARGLADLRRDTVEAFESQPAGRLFGPPIEAIEYVGTLASAQQATTVVYRDGVCEQARCVQADARERPGEVVVSSVLASLLDVHVGDSAPVEGLAGANGENLDLRVVGVYAAPNADAAYWFARGYFPSVTGATLGTRVTLDAFFTTKATFDMVAPGTGVSSVIDMPLNIDRVGVSDVPRVKTTLANTADVINEAQGGALYLTTIDAILERVEKSWDALALPVVLVTAQLLVLCWLLLFLVVTDAAEARGPEIALAKLRGLTRTQTVSFGLFEPMLLLLIALPLGVLVGWLSSVALSTVLLRDGTSVSMTPGGWLAATVAIAGGLVAAALAARRTLTRPVVAQWRRTERSLGRHSWIPDAVLITAAGAGLVQLFASGSLDSASDDVLALLVPGLLSLAIAVVAARLLPALCARMFRSTRRSGGIGTFLAVRQVARRPGGARTTIALATAFGLATFGIAAWVVERDNIHDVANADVGAAARIVVRAPEGTDLRSIVRELDPSGQHATVVSAYDDQSGTGTRLLGVDPVTFPRVAFWRDDFSAKPLAALTAQLTPPAPDSVVLTGSRVRLHAELADLTPRVPARVVANVTVANGFAPTPVALGDISPTGPTTLEAALPGCPCKLRTLELSTEGSVTPPSGRFVVTSMEQRVKGRWREVPDLTEADRWRPARADAEERSQTITSSGGRLQYTFSDVAAGTTLGLATVDRPDELPAIVTTSVIDREENGLVTTPGFDTLPLPLAPIATAPVPSSPANGAIVTDTYAQRASVGNSLAVRQEVWLTSDVAHTFPDELRGAGIAVLNEFQADSEEAGLRRQGPALALVLFLADAAAAAVLAAGGAVLALYLAGRRRSYELAALAATGARLGSLRRSLLAEQAMTLGFGALVGSAAGLLSARLALKAVPQFVERPAAPDLLYAPAPTPVLVALTLAVVVLAIAATISALSLVRSARPEQLREAPA